MAGRDFQGELSVVKKEKWMDIPGYEGLYQLSSHDRVRSIPHQVRNNKDGGIMTTKAKIKKPTRSKAGYLLFTLWKNGKAYGHCLHDLKLRVHVGPPPKGMECRHLNGDSTDNRIENLEWGTRQQNHDDKKRHGTTGKGKHRPGSSKKLKEKVYEILELFYTGRYSKSELGRMFGVDSTAISYHIKKGQKTNALA